MPDGSSSIPERESLTMSTMEVDSVGAAGAGAGGRYNSQMRCYNCGQLGHISSKWPLPETEDSKARKKAAKWKALGGAGTFSVTNWFGDNVSGHDGWGRTYARGPGRGGRGRGGRGGRGAGSGSGGNGASGSGGPPPPP